MIVLLVGNFEAQVEGKFESSFVRCKFIIMLSTAAASKFKSVQEGSYSMPGNSDADLAPVFTFSKKVNVQFSLLLEKQSRIIDLAKYVDRQRDSIDDYKHSLRRDLESKLNSAIDDDEFELVCEKLDEIMSIEAESNSDEQREIWDVLNGLPVKIARALSQSMHHSYRPAASNTYLLPGMLVSLVSDTEIAIGEFLKICYDVNPSSLNGSEAEFKWRDIESYSSIEDIKTSLIDRNVEELIRGSILDAFKGVCKAFGVKVPPDFYGVEVAEPIQRRHCIVHNSGNVSAAYIRNLNMFNVREVIGEPLPVDLDYLCRAADRLFFLYYQLVGVVGEKLMSKSRDEKEEFQHVMADVTFFMLGRARYRFIQLVDGCELTEWSDTPRLIAKTNIWLAHKFMGSFDLVRSEVEGFDVSSMSRQFSLAKFALLDRNEEAAEVARSMLRDEKIHPHHVHTWPLLRDVYPLLEVDLLEAIDGEIDSSPPAGRERSESSETSAGSEASEEVRVPEAGGACATCGSHAGSTSTPVDGVHRLRSFIDRFILRPRERGIQ